MSVQSLPTSFPAPRILASDEVPALRWGIMGPGVIATTWLATVLNNTKQRVVAAGSTSAERAEKFAEKFSLPGWYGSYDDLLADEEIDVVYIATRQHTHRDDVLRALAAGKHVLVEKPMATTNADAHAIRDAARASGKFVMEAMWTTYLPQSDIIRQLVDDGVLGEIRMVQADHSQDLRTHERLFLADGGGASHDLGIYSTAFVSSVLPEPPLAVSAIGDTNAANVDTEIIVRTVHKSGARAYASSSIINFGHNSAWVDGSNASLRVGSPFFLPSSLALVPREFAAPPVAQWSDETGIVAHEGLFYQVNAAAHFIGQGLTESPWRDLDASVLDIETITAARHLIGAFYPGER